MNADLKTSKESSGISRKGQGDKTDSVRLQKELCALHRYVDSVIKSDTILQQRFHCLGAGLTKDKVTIDFLDIPEWQEQRAISNKNNICFIVHTIAIRSTLRYQRQK